MLSLLGVVMLQEVESGVCTVLSFLMLLREVESGGCTVLSSFLGVVRRLGTADGP